MDTKNERNHLYFNHLFGISLEDDDFLTWDDESILENQPNRQGRYFYDISQTTIQKISTQCIPIKYHRRRNYFGYRDEQAPPSQKRKYLMNHPRVQFSMVASRKVVKRNLEKIPSQNTPIAGKAHDASGFYDLNPGKLFVEDLNETKFLEFDTRGSENPIGVNSYQVAVALQSSGFNGIAQECIARETEVLDKVYSGNEEIKNIVDKIILEMGFNVNGKIINAETSAIEINWDLVDFYLNNGIANGDSIKTEMTDLKIDPSDFSDRKVFRFVDEIK